MMWFNLVALLPLLSLVRSKPNMRVDGTELCLGADGTPRVGADLVLQKCSTLRFQWELLTQWNGDMSIAIARTRKPPLRRHRGTVNTLRRRQGLLQGRQPGHSGPAPCLHSEQRQPEVDADFPEAVRAGPVR